jgi:Cu-processing system permease protein
VTVVVAYALQEALRRKVFVVVLVLTALFLALYGLANHYVFRDVASIHVPADISVDKRAFAGAFILGMAAFATLFLGVVLAVFLTVGVVSGDAEHGLLQPLVVRPLGRSTLLVARFIAAAAVCTIYVVVVYSSAMVMTGLIGDWWPHLLLTPALTLAGAVALVAAVSLLGSIYLSSTANGIGVFMVFAAGLVSGLLGTIGHALGSHAVSHAARIAAWILPFEGLYEDSLRQITAHTSGLTGFLLQLGPFGGAYTGGWAVRGWAVVYLAAIGCVAVAAFARRDL